MKTFLAVCLLGISLNAYSYPGEISAEAIRYPLHVDAFNSRFNDFEVQFKLQREIVREVVTEEIVNVPLCLDVPVDQSSGDWKNYWNELSASEEVRAQALSVAIKGMDHESALLIVRHGLFMFRPRYWSEFEQQMRNAESALLQMGYTTHFYDLISIQFGSDNAHALGFWSDSNCRMNNVTRQVRKNIIAHEPAGILPRHYSIQILNPVLQSFEQDNFNIILSYDVNSARVERASEFNYYTAQVTDNRNGAAKIQLVAERRKVDIPEDAISGSLVRTNAGFEGDLAINANYLATNEASSKLMLYYELCSNWFLGCQTLDATRVTTTMLNNQLKVKIDGKFEVGQDYRIRYRFFRTASKYYDASGTEKLTERVAF